MRSLVALALARGVLLALVAWRDQPGETKDAVIAADAAPPPPAGVDADAPIAARRTEASPPQPSDPAAPRTGRLRLVEANSAQPLAEQALRLWVFASGTNAQLHLRSDREGMAQFEATAEQLAPGNSYAAADLEQHATASGLLCWPLGPDGTLDARAQPAIWEHSGFKPDDANTSLTVAHLLRARQETTWRLGLARGVHGGVARPRRSP